MSFLAKIRERINANKGATHENLIRVLNPIIRGWANYHRHINAKHTFKKADNAIRHALWCWAKRRHNNKSARWVVEKYWHPGEGRGWHFAADTGKHAPDGKPIRLYLERASAMTIRRHPKIKGEANPFDPAWRDYFEERVLLKRFGEEFVEQYGFLLLKGKQQAKSVMETGSAAAEL